MPSRQNESRIATWAAPLARCDIRLGSWYLASLTWALMLITGTGGTDYYPSSDSDAETIVVCAMVLCGALLWTYVLALFCDMATNSAPASPSSASCSTDSTSSSTPTGCPR